MQKYRLGDTVRVQKEIVFDPSDDFLDVFIKFNLGMPLSKAEWEVLGDDFEYVVLDTQEKVDQYNATIK